jgi:hypothetical protein
MDVFLFLVGVEWVLRNSMARLTVQETDSFQSDCAFYREAAVQGTLSLPMLAKAWCCHSVLF